MKKEAIEYLDLRAGDKIIDCTLGGGGYTMEIAKKVGPSGRVLAIDADKMAIENAKQKIAAENFKNIILAYGNFKDLQNIVKNELFGENAEFDGIVMDLGLSSAQLEDKNRGFSFQLDAPLNMAFGAVENGAGNKTVDIVNKYKREELRNILKEYGEEKYASKITDSIINYRKNNPIETTKQLVEIISGAVPNSYKNKKIHFATRTFQALRIATNDELKSLEKALPQARGLLKSKGRLVIISYHSLEDRIVKRFIKQESKECLCPPQAPICVCGHKANLKILTKKPIVPTEEEIKNNPRARSAKLRVAEKY